VIGIDAMIFAMAIIGMKYMMSTCMKNNFDIKYNSKNRNIQPKKEMKKGNMRSLSAGMSS